MEWKERKAAYYAKLKDPRWQQLRLRVFERDEWTCQLCGGKTNSLSVHHARYEDGEPWDTHIGLLFTACSECHEAEHQHHVMAVTYLLRCFGEIGIRTSLDLVHLVDAVENAAVVGSGFAHRSDFTPQLIADSLATAVREFEGSKRERIADSYWFRDAD